MILRPNKVVIQSAHAVCVSVMDITDIEDFRGIELALKIKEHFGVE